MEKVIITSSYTIEGYKILDYIEFISIEVVIGTGIFSEFKASFSDFFGSRSGAFQSKLSKIKTLAVKELREKAKELNGDAVISVDLDYTNFTQNIIGLIISGTVVKIEKDVENSNLMSVTSITDAKNLVDVNSPLYIRDKKIIRQVSENKTKKIFTEFSLINPLKNKISAIKFIIQLSTFFNESISFENSSEIVTNLTDEEQQTIKIEINSSNKDIISHIYVTIDKIGYENNDLWSSSGNIIEKNISEKDLNLYQKYFGLDSNCYPVKNTNDWICVCGNKNNNNEKQCSNCLRKIDEVFIERSEMIGKVDNKNKEFINQLTSNTRVWNKVEKMHARVTKVINSSEVSVHNKFGIFNWKISDCEIK